MSANCRPLDSRSARPSVRSRLPLPPLAIQRQLVTEVTAARSRIAAARAAATQFAADTAREVEEMILGVRPAPLLSSDEQAAEWTKALGAY